MIAATLIVAVLISQPNPSLPRTVMAGISAERVRADVDTLASFGTRHTLSDPSQEGRGIGAARRWLKSELERYGGGLRVEFEPFRAPKIPRMPDGGEVVNVVAVLSGSMPEARGRAYYVVGHYDSMNSDVMNSTADAPGANDDASGTTVVLECARALAGCKLDATVVFLCTAGEEQGLVGAKLHAAKVAADKPYEILGVLNNDIVGDPGTPYHAMPGGPTPDPAAFVRVFSEGLPRHPTPEQIAMIRKLGSENDSPSRQLARFVAYVAHIERMDFGPVLVFRQDRFLRGGDHSAFNDAGFPGVRFSVPTEDYSRQHADVTEKNGKPYGDLPSFVSAEYVANVARINAGTLVHLANAPRPPANARMIAAHLETGTTLRWDRCPEPDTAGYEVVWRRTTASDWEGSLDAATRPSGNRPPARTTTSSASARTTARGTAARSPSRAWARNSGSARCAATGDRDGSHAARRIRSHP